MPPAKRLSLRSRHVKVLSLLQSRSEVETHAESVFNREAFEKGT